MAAYNGYTNKPRRGRAHIHWSNSTLGAGLFELMLWSAQCLCTQGFSTRPISEIARAGVADGFTYLYFTDVFKAAHDLTLETLKYYLRCP